MGPRHHQTFDELPLFASDLEIGYAVVGARGAAHWAVVTVKNLEKQLGFPRFDEAHMGRYTPGVRRYYEIHHGGLPGQRQRSQERPEDRSAWKNRRSNHQV